jgi:hypothetical protein
MQAANVGRLFTTKRQFAVHIIGRSAFCMIRTKTKVKGRWFSNLFCLPFFAKILFQRYTLFVSAVVNSSFVWALKQSPLSPWISATCWNLTLDLNCKWYVNFKNYTRKYIYVVSLWPYICIQGRIEGWWWCKGVHFSILLFREKYMYEKPRQHETVPVCSNQDQLMTCFCI